MATKDNNTARVFNEIAESWYRLRHRTRFKTELEELALRWDSGKLLNVGCAHGPDFLPFRDKFELYGIDCSENMLRMAIKYSDKYHFHADLLVADARLLPFSDHSFEWAIAVAVYHHVISQSERYQAFTELHRVLKRNGEAFITLWNKWQPEFLWRGKQVSVPWHAKSGTLLRHHYLYDYIEIERVLRKCGFNLIWSRPERAYRLPLKYFSRNICLLVKAT